MFPWEVCQANEACHYSTFQLTWTIGIVIGAIVYGALITLGLCCVRLLRPQCGKDSLQARLLQGHVFALLLVNTIFGVVNFLWANFYTIFAGSISSRDDRERAFSSIQLLCTLTIVTVGMLTDGLLVWRCYMVQRVLMSTQRRITRTLSWLFPASLWLAMIGKAPMYSLSSSSYSHRRIISLVCGTTGGVITKKVTTPGRLAEVSTALLTAAMGANILLNLYTTAFIIIRLVLYRRMIRGNLGKPIGKHHTRVVGILLESAAINVPITVIAVVGIATWSTYGDFMMSVVVPGQSFASVLVMYQIAVGKAIDTRSDALRTSGAVDVF